MCFQPQAIRRTAKKLGLNGDERIVTRIFKELQQLALLTAGDIIL